MSYEKYTTVAEETATEEATPEAEEATKEETQEEAPAEETKDEKADEDKKAEATKEEDKEKSAPKAEEKKEEKAEESESLVNESVEVPKEFKKLVEQVEQMSVLELHELVKVLEKRFGVSAAAVAVSGGGGADEAVAEEQTEFTIELTEAGGQKIAVIKVVKEACGLGLKEAKDMVDNAPTEVKTGVGKEEAEELKAKLEEAGATVTLK